MKKKFYNYSRREFLLIIVEQGKAREVKFDLTNLFYQDENDYEYIYALSDEIDNILDLQINENIHVQGNRDNKHSKGVLTRIK